MDRRFKPSVYLIAVTLPPGVVVARYVGSSMKGTIARKYSHLHACAINDRYEVPGLRDAFWAYGEESLVFVTLEEFDQGAPREKLAQAERDHFQAYVARYGRDHMINVADGGDRGKPSKPIRLYDSLLGMPVSARSQLDLAVRYGGDESAIRRLVAGKLHYHRGLVRSEEIARYLWGQVGGQAAFVALDEAGRRRVLWTLRRYTTTTRGLEK